MMTPAMIYASIGAVLWLVLDGLGIIDNTFAARNRVSARAMVMATVMMIALWPWFVWSWLKGMWRTRT